MKPKKNLAFLAFCILALTAVCGSCGMASPVEEMGKKAEIALEEKEPFLNLSEQWEWIYYRLQGGETLLGLGFKYRVPWNFISDDYDLTGVEEVRIPGMNGLFHKVENGDTISRLSKKYHVPQEIIADVNNIKDDAFIETEYLFIPNPFMPNDAGFLTERFMYPVQGGSITRSFGWQEEGDTRVFHPGIDIRLEADTAVRASMSGDVIEAGISKLHGKYVILRHDVRGYLTLYSHLSEVSIKEGDFVRQGKIIGEINTENGNEPHLIFGIFREYNALNPHSLTFGNAYNALSPLSLLSNEEYNFDDAQGYIFQVFADEGGEATRIISYMGKDSVIHIPAAIKNLPVRQIGGKAFFKRGLTGVMIPDGITCIGVSAFSENKLRRIAIPHTVRIIDYMAFAYNKLSNVIIPDSVTTIEEYAFVGNNISRAVIPNSVTYMGGAAFDDNKLSRITIPHGVSTIKDSVFCDNKLRSITVPSNITSIGDFSFEGNYIVNLELPDKIESIGIAAFRGNRLTSVVIPDGVTAIGGMAFTENNIRQITIGADVRLERSTVQYDSGSVVDYGAFGLGFDYFYLSHGRRAGGYIYRNGNWEIKGAKSLVPSPQSL